MTAPDNYQILGVMNYTPAKLKILDKFYAAHATKISKNRALQLHRLRLKKFSFGVRETPNETTGL